jgi:hypothetical protein
MADQGERPAWLTRDLLVAVTIAFAFWIAALLVLDWGMIPAIIGGGSVGVIWWSVNRAFQRSQ